MYALIFSRVSDEYEVYVHGVYPTVDRAKELAVESERAIFEEVLEDDPDTPPFELPAWAHDEDTDEHTIGGDDIYSGGTWTITEVNVEA